MVLELCDDHSLTILNRRFEGNSEGEYTFIGGMGCSATDYCCVSLECISFIDDFKIISVEFSDHLPLSFSKNVKSYPDTSSSVVLPDSFNFLL